MDLALEDLAGELVDQLALDQPLDRPGAVDGVVAVLHHVVLEGAGEGEGDVLVLQLLAQDLHLDAHDLADVVRGQGVEDHDLVDTVEELRPHAQAQLLLLEVGGHDEDGVLEVHRAALVVGQTAVVQHLQQDVEHVRMRLLDLVQQDHGVGLAPHGLGQLAALVVADVSRRRADQAADGVALLVLAHVDTGHHRLVVEEELRQRLGELGLAHAGGAQEEEGADGPVLVGQAGAAAAHGVGHGRDGLVLADHALVQFGLHPQELLLLALHHPGDRNAGPAGHDLGDVLGRDGLGDDRVLDGGLLRGQLVDALLRGGELAVADLRHLAVVAGALGDGRLALVVLDLLAGVVELGHDAFLLRSSASRGRPARPAPP